MEGVFSLWMTGSRTVERSRRWSHALNPEYWWFKGRGVYVKPKLELMAADGAATHTPANISLKWLWTTAWEHLCLWTAENRTIAFRPASWNGAFRNADRKKCSFSDFYLQHLTCRFCKDPKRGFSSSCSMFSAMTRKYFWIMKNYNKGHECPNKITTVPIDWMVKAHVVQTIRGTRGHNSLGAVCSPTVWTLVAHTPSISIMLSDNFVLNEPETENSDTQCEAWAFGKNQIWKTASLTVAAPHSSE